MDNVALGIILATAFIFLLLCIAGGAVAMLIRRLK